MKGLPRTNRRGASRSAAVRDQFRISNLTVPITDPGAAIAYGSVDTGLRFPQGNLLMHGFIFYGDVFSSSANIIDTFTCTIGFGSTATADATLTGTDINIAGTTTSGTATSKKTPIIRCAGIQTQNGNLFDNTDNQFITYLNMTIPDASISGSANVIVNGSIEVVYTILGDD